MMLLTLMMAVGSALSGCNDSTPSALSNITATSDNSKNPGAYVDVVLDGFIDLDEAIVDNDNIISYAFWESNVSFFDLDGKSIGQFGREDSSIILHSNRKTYINADVFDDMLVVAQETKTIRDTIYELGDTVEFIDYTLTVSDVVYSDQLIASDNMIEAEISVELRLNERRVCASA